MGSIGGLSSERPENEEQREGLLSSPELRPSRSGGGGGAVGRGGGGGKTGARGTAAPSTQRLLWCCLVLCAALLWLMSLVAVSHPSAQELWLSSASAGGASPLPPQPGQGRTLIIYVHYPAELNYVNNLHWFIDRAVRCWQSADYLFIIQNDHASEWEGQPNNRSWADGLPALPPNARYVLHQNECWDWGTVGWLLQLPQGHPNAVDTSAYRYFILMNSSVRGPFFPRYVEEQMDPSHSVQCSGQSGASSWPSSFPSFLSSPSPSSLFTWYHALLTLLSSDVRYVGCTVNCLYWAHVQSYVVATDFVGLQVLWQADGLQNNTRPIHLIRDWAEWQRLPGGVQSLPPTGAVFLCPISYWNAIEKEMGASQAMLKAGFNFAVLMRFWQGVDFRAIPEPCHTLRLRHAEMDPTSQGVPCFRHQEIGPDNPLTALEPLEVLFIKHKKREAHPTDRRMEQLIEWEFRAQRTAQWQAAHTERRAVIYPGNLSLTS